jgi:hypothetical protein
MEQVEVKPKLSTPSGQWEGARISGGLIQKEKVLHLFGRR